MGTYMTTVQLLIESDTLHQAADAVENILSIYDMSDGRLEDWGYLKVGNQHLAPTRFYELPAPSASHGPGQADHKSEAAGLLLHKALSAVDQIKNDIVDEHGGTFSCFVTGFQSGNEVCQTSDSPVCTLCRDLQP